MSVLCGDYKSYDLSLYKSLVKIYQKCKGKLKYSKMLIIEKMNAKIEAKI